LREEEEQFEVLAQAQQAGFGAYLVRHVVPLRTADSAEQNRVCRQRLFHVFFRNRLPVGIVGAAADESLFSGETGTVFVHDRDQFLHLRHRLGADAVAWEEEEFFRSHEIFPRGIFEPPLC
jgi:hypothetical protein